MRRIHLWLYLCAMALVAFYLGTAVADLPDRNWLDGLTVMLNNIIFFQLPLQAWLITSSVTRNQSPARDWVWTTGVDMPSLLLGQVLALLTGVLLSLVVMLAIFSTLMLAEGLLILPNLGAFWLLTLSLALPLTLFEFFIVLALALAFRRTLLVVVFVAVLYALLVLRVLAPYTTLFNPLNYTLLSLRIDPVAGIGAEQLIIGGLVWLYLSLAVSALPSVLWGVAQIDPRVGWRRRQRWWVTAPLVVGLMSSAFATYFYQGAVQDRIVPPPVTDQVDLWQVTNAKHTGRIDGASMHITAQLQLVNTSNTTQQEIILALNPGLVNEQSRVNGQTVNVKRTGEVIRLTDSSLAVASGQSVVVEFVYAGTPVLLREDYVRPLGGPSGLPTMFARPVRTYFDSDVLLLQRDGDWRAWPQNSGLRLNEQSVINLTFANHPKLISSGTVTQQDSQQVSYSWGASIPQLLVAAGDYQTTDAPHGTIAVTSWSARRDIDRAEKALEVRRTLDAYLVNESAPVTYQAVILPYAGKVVAGGALIGLPATSERLFAGTGMDLAEYRRWSDGVLALQTVEALLAERIEWATRPLSTDGQIGAFSTECTVENGQETCSTLSIGGVSPQAPHGRLVEQPTAPLLRAWSIVLSRYAMPGALDDETIAEEHKLWQIVSGAVTNSREQTPSESESILVGRGLLSRSALPHETQNLAQLVTQIEQLRQTLGNDEFIKLLKTLAVTHPPGGPPLSEDTFQRLASAAIVQVKGP